MTYLLLSLAFLAAACTLALIARARVGADRRRLLLRRWWRPAAITALALVLLTVLFDNIMIAAGFMVYSDAHTIGLFLGLAPIEDFSYPIAGLILLPALWLLLGPRTSNDAHE